MNFTDWLQAIAASVAALATVIALWVGVATYRGESKSRVQATKSLILRNQQELEKSANSTSVWIEGAHTPIAFRTMGGGSENIGDVPKGWIKQTINDGSLSTTVLYLDEDILLQIANDGDLPVRIQKVSIEWRIYYRPKWNMAENQLRSPIVARDNSFGIDLAFNPEEPVSAVIHTSNWSKFTHTKHDGMRMWEADSDYYEPFRPGDTVSYNLDSDRSFCISLIGSGDPRYSNLSIMSIVARVTSIDLIDSTGRKWVKGVDKVNVEVPFDSGQI
ncbi:hypothetical protein [Specibacter sp. NPDC078709]|uniref:hypothetical protein n=1 Tax=Specibacter sp. NPDC078709 TaxID=3154364 RepID=UPI00341EA2CB